MEPSDKHPNLEKQLTRVFGFSRRAVIECNKCAPFPAGCGGDATEFRDEKSRKEYSISGLCQKCQDSVFGE